MWLIHTTKYKFLNKKISLSYANTNLSEILNQIGTRLNINFFLICNREIIVKEMEIKNQSLKSVLLVICDLFSLYMTITENDSIQLTYKEPNCTKVYKIKFFHTNNINNSNKIFWDNNIFWESVEKFLHNISQDIVIDKYNGNIIVTCDKKKHNIIESYILEIEKQLYRPIEIECVFIEASNMEEIGSGLGEILSNLAVDYSEIDSLTKVFFKNLPQLTNNRLSRSSCEIIARQKLTILPQQVAVISIEDLEERTEKTLVYGKQVVSSTTSNSDKLINGLSLGVSALNIKNNKILCKIFLQINRLFKETNNVNKQSSLSTTIKLCPHKILVVGDLISQKTNTNHQQGLLGRLFGRVGKSVTKSSIAVILKGKVCDV